MLCGKCDGNPYKIRLRCRFFRVCNGTTGTVPAFSSGGAPEGGAFSAMCTKTRPLDR